MEILREASDQYEIAGINPCSAAEARRKTPSVANMMCKHPMDRWLSHYEPEDTRSKRVGGILHFLPSFFLWGGGGGCFLVSCN
jgi:hypothetical protein